MEKMNEAREKQIQEEQRKRQKQQRQEKIKQRFNAKILGLEEEIVENYETNVNNFLALRARSRKGSLLRDFVLNF